ncbi:hypothetical protein EJ05DRAFT_473292 [Pseudovirgaria hyperparasitica]|uniref:Uncharacterized protein n=1 Tax=Pseudovirgaria hyperparasitica TaxID=470096 RepID=A0A6A6WJY7_9PEZI|nr:uncharacterized protein EJ05DRAFT_473292 [Pseudovirgaria hyperparasitica]KAF2762377.1 hypothetical protein EJ05DRAFT_473292 [Pseudovirgaria hyperparasitica]
MPPIQNTSVHPTISSRSRLFSSDSRWDLGEIAIIVPSSIVFVLMCAYFLKRWWQKRKNNSKDEAIS